MNKNNTEEIIINIIKQIIVRKKLLISNKNLNSQSIVGINKEIDELKEELKELIDTL